jgi:acetyl esterase
MSHEFDVEDREYLRHGSRSLLARIFRPKGKGPFPAMLELHGGSWASFDRTRGVSLHEGLARSGVIVVAIDFRYGPETPAPASAVDANYGVRWVKAHAAELGTRPDMVGISGNSSGGHSAILTAMRPRDTRYAAIPLAGGYDATVECVLMLWPIVNPLSRYRHAKKALSRTVPTNWAERVIKNHDDYWKTEAAMAEGSPLLLLEKGEKMETPPALWIQSTRDEVHNYRDPDSSFEGTEADRFVDRYRKAGGEIDLVYYDAPTSFTTVAPGLPESIDSLERAAAFVRRRIAR